MLIDWLQTAKADMFHIDRAGMAALHAELRSQRVMVAAQVHSHPEAFHSRADDQWAIVRHGEPCRSSCLILRARRHLKPFFPQTKVFQFSASAQWIEVPEPEVQACLDHPNP